MTFFDDNGHRLTESELAPTMTGEISGTRHELVTLLLAVSMANGITPSKELKEWGDRINQALKDIEFEERQNPF